MSQTPEQILASLSEEERLQMVRLNPALHFGAYLAIYDKDNRLVPAKPNILQRRMAVAFVTLRLKGVPIRMIVCKIRQCGGTTFGLETIYTESRNKRTEALIIADDIENSKKILSRLGDYRTNDAFDWGNTMSQIQGKTRFSHGSNIEVDSAQSWNPGVARTRQAALFSEIGKWPKKGVRNDASIARSVLPSIPQRPGTVVIAEGTPEGASGWMYTTWQGGLYLDEFLAKLEAGEPVPGNGWVKVFAAWFEFEENRLPIRQHVRDAILRSLSEREQRGIELYGWTPEQIAWRRATIANECSDSEDAFDEYYPEDDETCWLTSGRPRFNQRAIASLKKRASSLTPEIGFLVRQENGTVSWTPDPSGDIEIFEHPRPGMRYLNWCDPATGEDQTQGKDPDRHSIGTMRVAYADETGNERNTMVVARVRPPFRGESDLVAAHIANLSSYYGRSIVVLEVNMGLHILELLKYKNVPLYRRKVIAMDPEQQDEKFQFGFKLKDRNLRRAVLDCLATHLREGKLDCFDPHALEEMRSFRIDDNGDERAPSGKHDDDVLGIAMALYSLGSATLYVEQRRKRRLPKDFKNWKALVYS